MKPYQQGKPIVYVKNLHRKGKTVYKSSFGDIELEISKAKGSNLYIPKVEGESKGVSYNDALQAWMFLSEYLSVAIEELPKVSPSKKGISKGNKTLDKGDCLEDNTLIKKKHGQSKWSH